MQFREEDGETGGNMIRKGRETVEIKEEDTDGMGNSKMGGGEQG